MGDVVRMWDTTCADCIHPASQHATPEGGYSERLPFKFCLHCDCKDYAELRYLSDAPPSEREGKG